MQWLLPLWLLAAAAAHADTPSAPAQSASSPVPGAETRQWLDSQRQGRQAAGKAQPLSGPVQEQVYERYRKSFSHPIPDKFERESLGSGGATR